MENSEFRILALMLAPEALEHTGKSGGMVRMTEILKRIGSNGKFKITVVCADRESGRIFADNPGIEVRLIKPLFKFRRLGGLVIKSMILVLKFIIFHSGKYLKLGGNTVIYSGSDLFWEVVPAYCLKARNSKFRWIQVIHHIYPDWKKRSGSAVINFFGFYLQQFSLWLIKKRADRIVVVNQRTKEKLVALGFSGNRIIVSSNGLDYGYLENIKSADKIYEGIFLGRLNHSKGIWDLLEIWKKVVENYPQARLAVIGGGNEETKEALRKKIREYELMGNVDILGYMENDKAYPILKSGKVFLFPSHEEGWGIAITEAMACGLPVVSWNLPVYQEVFEDYTFQAEENNIDDFSAKVIELLKNENSRYDSGEKGKEFIRKYSWEEVARKETEIIRELYK